MSDETEIQATEVAYDMARSSKGFRILSSGLYSDGILAVVREVIHNALDAHASIGKHHRPISVHLPCPGAMFFAARDYGPGIADRLMRSIYATYFGSSKGGDNTEFSGRLGLGSKAPFAYTPLFNVSSFQAGIRRDYTLFFNRDDEPVLTPCLTCETGEEDGLEVYVAVQSQQDAQVFAQRLRQVCEFLTVQPEIRGGEALPPIQPTILLETKNGRIFWDEARDRRAPRAVQNQIAYPISRSDVHGLVPPLSAMLTLPLVLYMEPNSLQFVPSREHLTYDGDSPTRASIEVRLSALLSDVRRLYASRFADCTSEYEARVRWLSLRREKGWIALTDAIRPAWGAAEIRTDTITITPPPSQNLKVISIHRRRDGSSVKKKEYDLSGATFFSFSCEPLTRFYLNDTSRGALSKVVSIARQGFKTEENLNKTESTIYYVMGDIEAVRQFGECLKGTPHTFTSTLIAPSPEKKRVRLKARAIRQCHRYEGALHETVDKAFDTEAGGYHMVTRSHSPEHPTIKWDTGRWTVFYRRCRAEKWFDADADQLALIPLTIARGHRLRSDPRWPDFIPAMQEKARAKYDRPENALAVARSAQIDQIDARFIFKTLAVRLDWRALADSLPRDHLIGRAWRVYDQWTESVGMASETLSAMDAMDFRITIPTIVNEPDQLLTQMNERYPMLRLVLGALAQVSPPDRLATMQEYIASIDRARIATLLTDESPAPPQVRERPRLRWRDRVKKK